MESICGEGINLWTQLDSWTWAIWNWLSAERVSAIGSFMSGAIVLFGLVRILPGKPRVRFERPNASDWDIFSVSSMRVNEITCRVPFAIFNKSHRYAIIPKIYLRVPTDSLPILVIEPNREKEGDTLDDRLIKVESSEGTIDWYAIIVKNKYAQRLQKGIRSSLWALDKKQVSYAEGQDYYSFSIDPSFIAPRDRFEFWVRLKISSSSSPIRLAVAIEHFGLHRSKKRDFSLPEIPSDIQKKYADIIGGH